MSWIDWEEQTCNQIACLCRAIGCRIPLRTIWMGKTIKLLDFVGKCHTTDQRNQKPGSVYYDKVSNTLAVCCKVCLFLLYCCYFVGQNIRQSDIQNVLLVLHWSFGSFRIHIFGLFSSDC
ncbi:hypothetical protein XENOCAPTIV_015848 [Xenoophorus captivus]|uniref:Formyl transferase C-terminal domain-containing protein n=1 Tax=Xenoophorus captivus TaxID=1517983 RepID=A0ABV0QJR9_9TELE